MHNEKMRVEDRYEVVRGPNTKQLWIYDNKTNEFIDPPAKLLDKIDRDYPDFEDAKVALLMHVITQTTQPNGGWLNDGHRYDADNIEI